MNVSRAQLKLRFLKHHKILFHAHHDDVGPRTILSVCTKYSKIFFLDEVPGRPASQISKVTHKVLSATKPNHTPPDALSLQRSHFDPTRE